MTGVRYTFSFLTVLVVSCYGQSEEPDILLKPLYFENIEQPLRVCSTPGSICSTCSAVSICIGNGDGSITTVSQPCRDDENCVGGQCVQGALCNYRPFRCSEEGFFPDPYDCTRYHVCVPSGGYGTPELMSFQCSSGSYDAFSASCGYPLNTTSCVDRPVPDCTSRLQIGAIASDPNLYYICVETDGTLAPELHKCPGGYPFKADKLSCKGDSKETKEKKKSKKIK